MFNRECEESDDFCMSAYEADVVYDRPSAKYKVRYLRKVRAILDYHICIYQDKETYRLFKKV